MCRVLLVGKCFAGSLELCSFFEGLGVRLHFSETLAGAVSLLRLRRFDLVLSQTQLPEGSAYRLLGNLLTSTASLVLSCPVESGHLWVPAIWNGQPCWGTTMLRPAEFRANLRELLVQTHAKDSGPQPASAQNAGRTAAISSAATPARSVHSLFRKASKNNVDSRPGKQTAEIHLQSSGVQEGEARLVAAAARGCNEAFETLVGHYQARTLCIVRRLVRNREDAEDIVQQSFQKVFVHLHQFEGISSFYTWLTRIAINEALMWLRRKRKSREVSIEEPRTGDVTVLPLDLPDPTPSPEDCCLRREWKLVLSQAMDELTPALREAVQLRELEELSTKETARALGLSVHAVKSRVFRGRRKLRALLRIYD